MSELNYDARLVLLLVIANGGSVKQDDLSRQFDEWWASHGPPDEEKLRTFAESIPGHKWELARAAAGEVTS